MRFVDSTTVIVRSGRGGPGLVSFKSARNCAKMGADGGDGGAGGDVWLVASTRVNTLSHIRLSKSYIAESGERGGPNTRTGKRGTDLEIEVPLGTQIFDDASGTMFGELLNTGERIMVAKGGKRGIGNKRFLSSRHQAPEESTPGGEAEERTLRLELKLIADVGLCGYPNAGKSTLISRLSAARPKIANYPFTTLEPQLGVVDAYNAGDFIDRSFLLADIPGLIEGASLGKGLGHQFLKHLERTKLLAFVIDISDTAIEDAPLSYEVLCQELNHFSTVFASKDRVLILNKSDASTDPVALNAVVEYFAENNPEIPLYIVSAVSGAGIEELRRGLCDKVYSHRLGQKSSDQPVEDRTSKNRNVSDLWSSVSQDLVRWSETNHSASHAAT